MFTLPERANEINLNDNDAIRLPFPALYAYWRNGNPQLKQNGGIHYFGGWAFSDESYEDAVTELGKTPGLDLTSFVNVSGKELAIYQSRSLPVAPIAKRKRWLDTDQYHGSQVQILCSLFIYNKEAKHYDYFSPIVLSGKGYSGLAIEDSFDEWAKASAKARKEYAGGAPAVYFIAGLGTFAKTPVTKEVGKKNKNTITPCQVYLPLNKETAAVEITSDHLKTYFVGTEHAALMLQLKDEAKEWLETWKDTKSKTDAGDVPPEPVEEADIPF
jgi:hypothetical protein